VNPRVLLICYYFPPLGGAGVGRPLSLFRQLPSHGIECDVLTVKDVAYRVFEPELLADLDTTRVHLAGSRDPQRLLRLLGIRKVGAGSIRRVGWLSRRFFPDPKVGWVKPAVRLGRQLARKRRYSALLSTSPPISCHLVAQALSAETGLPWIADFRDFWTSYRIEDGFSDSAKRRQAWEIVESIKKSAAVTACNPAISAYLSGGEVIYNGYDDELARLWRAPKSDSRFHIGLFGTFDQLVPVDPLLKVLAVLRDRSPQLFERVRLLQVGQIDPAWLNAALDRYGVRDICICHGFRSRRRSIEILNEAALFFIALATPQGSGIVPSRLFDMLASGRPILGAVEPGGPTAGLIAKADHHFCLDSQQSESVSESAAFLESLIERYGSGQLSILPCPEYARPYSAGAMVDRFARLIESISRVA